MKPAIRKSASAPPTNFRTEYFVITNLLVKLRDATRTGQDASRLSRYNKLLVPSFPSNSLPLGEGRGEGLAANDPLLFMFPGSPAHLRIEKKKKFRYLVS